MKVGPVREAHRIDEGALHSWLRERVPGGDAALVVEQFDAGQSNPTYRVSMGERRYVLRKKPPGKLLPKAHAVEREARVMAALGPTPVPVPKIFGTSEDEAIIGTPFFVMEMLEGRILWDARLPDEAPQTRAAMWAEMVRVLAAMHSVDIEVVGLGDYGRRGNYFARQVATWTKQYRRAETERIEAMEQLISWLPAHLPDDDTTALVHGDYRLDNVVWHPTEPVIIGVLDWELSTLGHPLADVAYSCLPFLMDTPYHPALGPLAGRDGLPSMDQHLAAYCGHTGRSEVPDLPFTLAFSMFRIASILQGVYARGIQGNASSTRALKMGALARQASEAAWTVAQKG